MTLDELMDFAQFLAFEATIERNESCNRHPEYSIAQDLVLSETARWWTEHNYGNEA